MLLIKPDVLDKVCAGNYAGGSAAGKNGFRLPVARFYNLVFKKRDGKKGNGAEGTNFIGLYSQVPDEARVDWVILGLVPEEIQSNISEGTFVYCVQLRFKTFKSIQAFLRNLTGQQSYHEDQ